MIPGPNWTRRYGSPSRRLCARAGCGAQAAATLRFQPTRREAWLVELDDSAARTEGDLCNRHATDLVLPRGWALHDQRAIPTVAPPVDGAAPTRFAEAAARTIDVVTTAVARPADIELDEPAGPAAAARTVRGRRPRRSRRPESVPAPAIGPATESDDLADLLDAQTPLLRRAFGNVQLDE